MNKQVLAIVVLTFSSTTFAHSDVNVALAANANVLTQDSMQSLFYNLHQDPAFSKTAEITAYGNNSKLAQALADRMKVEDTIKLNSNTFAQQVLTVFCTGATVFVTGAAIIALLEWYSNYKVQSACTAQQIEQIKVKIAEEKAKQITLKKAEVAFA